MKHENMLHLILRILNYLLDVDDKTLQKCAEKTILKLESQSSKHNNEQRTPFIQLLLDIDDTIFRALDS